MKKIFLTSGLVLCMACPAFAAGSGFPSTSDGNTVNNACTEPYLGVYNGPTTLKAQWTAQTHNVTYAPGTPSNATASVSGLPSNTTATYDAPFTVSATEPTLTGWDFVNWTSDYKFADGDNVDTDYNPGAGVQQYKVADDVTLTANWQARTFTVSYSCTGDEPYGTATGTINDYTATYDSPFDANDGSACSLPGHTFAGWSCTNGAQDNPSAVTLPADQAKWNLLTGATCTAQWNAEQITITWDDDDATTFADDGTPNCSYGASVTLPTKPTKTGYTFGGWEVVTATPATPAAPTAAECEADPTLEGCE